jgi:hypothetical protein
MKFESNLVLRSYCRSSPHAVKLRVNILCLTPRVGVIGCDFGGIV